MADTHSRRTHVSQLENDAVRSSDVSDQDAGDEAQESPFSRLDSGSADVTYANFSLRHGLQDADPNLLGALAKVGLCLVAGGAVLAIRKVIKRERLDVTNAWRWSSEDAVPVTDQLNIAKPLIGISLVVAEKYASSRASGYCEHSTAQLSCLTFVVGAITARKTIEVL
jgi:hypothetical protein